MAAIAALALLIGQCAQQGAPQGGSPDTTPPNIETTIPASGDVMVSRMTSLTFQFSEPVEKPTFASALKLSPARSGRPEYRWSNGGRRVEVFWADTLRDSTSYRVTVSNLLADRRSNKLAEPFNFAFSTGPQVDRGEIRGRIVTSGGNSSAYDVFAYRLEALPDTFWLVPPDYTTQSAADGRFQLPFLRAGEYRVLVLSDANRNLKLEHGEQAAIATRDFAVADDRAPDSALWYSYVYDTVPFTIRECQGTSPALLTITFSHPLDTTTISDWRFDVLDTNDSSDPAVFSLIPPTQRRPSAVALFGSWRQGAGYSVIASGIVDQRGELLPSDTCSCVYTPSVDTAPPRIDAVVLPTVNAAFSPKGSVQFLFSEPVDTARLNGAGSVADTLGSTVTGEWVWRDPQAWIFTPSNSWNDSTPIFITIDSSQVADLSGNLARAGVYKWRFNALGESRMGELEIQVEHSTPVAATVWIEVRGVGDNRVNRLAVPASGQLSVGLPSGKWLLSGYIDLNGDGRWSHGRLMPYMPSEPRATHPDTLDIRARFTLEDVVVKF